MTHVTGSRARAAVLFCALSVLVAWGAEAQNLTVYDDALQNGFLDYSYGGGSNFASTAQVYSGTHSIAFGGNNFNSLSFARPGAPLSTATYPTLHFRAHGGTTGGQQLRLYLQLNDVIVASAELDSFIEGGALAAGAWREVTVSLASGVIAYDGSFDRIDLQSDTAGAQATLYLDEITLTQPPAVASAPMQIEHDVTVSSMSSERFTWRDSANQPRVAVLAHNDNAPVGSFRGGALREFRYQLPDGATRVAGVTTYGNAGYGGFGYVVSHASRSTCVGDDSPLGGVFAGTWERVFEGRHHAIIRFTQNYRRNCSTTPPQARVMPVTIEWLVRTGQDHPLWTITWHVSDATPSAPVGTFFDDSRAPYGELNIDGMGFEDIDGVAWGDRYKFTSTTAPVTLNRHWTWNVANTIPYVKLWIAGPLTMPNRTRDATMGIVQTQPMDSQDAGGGRNPDYDGDPLHRNMTYFWGKTSADGNAGDGYRMPWQNEWPYQANAFNLGPAAPNNNARLTWGTQYGFLGQSTYDVNDGIAADAPGYPKKSYSTYVVMGTHTSNPVETQVAQVETMQSVTLDATVGTVVTSGPAGIARADTVTYVPAGYNHVYGALALQASGNEIDANVSVGEGTLRKPLLIIGNYSGGEPEVLLDGVLLVADADYFASTRPSANELWLTLNRDLTGATNRLQLTGSSTVPDAPTIGTAIPGNGSATVSFTPPANDGGSPITGYLVTCNPGAKTQSGGSSPITVTTLTNGTPYTCSVVAMNANGSSAASGTVGVTPSGVPANFSATATSSTVVALVWNAVGGASSYEIHRSSGGGAFALLTTTAAISYNDATAAANTTYLYKVRVIAPAASAFTAVDAATTVIFTDPTLTAATTKIKLVHIAQLRTAVNAMRAAGGLAAAVFTDPALTTAMRPKAVHVSQLRTALDAARTAIGLPALAYTDPTLTAGTTKVKALHLTQLRNGVK
jgi:hypothetical protein